MSELRWILLGAGVALILGLWWWESRRSRSAADDPTNDRPRSRAEPSLGGAHDRDDAGVPGATFAAASGTPPAHQPAIDRQRPLRRPPVVEIPDDVEVDISDYVGRDRRRMPGTTGAIAEVGTTPRVDDEAPRDDRGGAEAEDAAPGEDMDVDHRAPWISTQPLERSEVAPQRETEPEEPPPQDPIERHAAEASVQRIVALRLVATDARWNGRQLREAIEAEGLKYGRYSIYHREREDGKSLFYVASMMEPGSFDLATMDSQSYPGISLFGIVPGPLDAPATFDMVLAAGRRLAERLSGQLQDEQGSTLTAQRILNLREDLVHFEHRHKRLRRS